MKVNVLALFGRIYAEELPPLGGYMNCRPAAAYSISSVTDTSASMLALARPYRLKAGPRVRMLEKEEGEVRDRSRQ